MGNATTNDKKGPVISVIVPVYNSEKTLERCIGGILSQSFVDFELILVDDGSTDSSAGICDRYARSDSRIRVLSKRNGGVSSARNLGIEQASGEFIAFCDSDDYAESNWLSSMYEAIGDAGMAVGGYTRVTSDGTSVEESAEKGCRLDRPAEILETLLGHRLLQFVWNKLFRRSVIMESGLRFDESFTIFEDEYFVLNYLALDHTVVCVPECGYVYFLPENFYSKYDFGIDAFRKVTEAIGGLTDERVRLPGVIYWYKIALGRYARTHTFSQSREKIKYARTLAWKFRDGALNHLAVRILPSWCIYRMLRRRDK